MDESEPSPDAEREEWHAISKADLARAYSDDEPDYPAILVRNQGNPQGTRRRSADAIRFISAAMEEPP